MVHWGILWPFRVEVDGLLDLGDIPDAWRTDYENCLFWQRQRTDHDTLFVFWDSAAGRCISWNIFHRTQQGRRLF